MIQLAFQKKLNAASGPMTLDIDLNIQEGQFLALYGKSGAGKTSFLRIVAGLMKADQGFIQVNDKIWLDTTHRVFLKPRWREVGMVFQDYALFPNMSIRDNLLYALNDKKDKQFVEELIEIVELGELQHRKPSTLSGGQKQRVALARALVQRPKLLLLDEPLSALDRQIRHKLQDHILEVHRTFKLTTILVSHDLQEVRKMADLVLRIEKGKIIEQLSAQQFGNIDSISQSLSIIGFITEIKHLESQYLISVFIGEQHLSFRIPPHQATHLQVGDQIKIQLDASNLFLEVTKS